MMEKKFANIFKQSISEWRTHIMGVSIFAIMLFHQWFFKSNPFPFNVFHNFGHWGVDIFLFLSGMGLTRSLQRNSIPMFYKRRFSRIVPSSIVFGTTKYIIFILLGSPVIVQQALNLGVISLASLDLWFIDTIIILYVLAPLLFKYLNKSPISTFFCILFIYFSCQYLFSVIVFDRMSPLGLLSWTIRRLPVFSLGMFFSIREEWDGKYLYISIFCFLMAIIMAIANKRNLLDPSCYHTTHYLILSIGTPSMIMLIILLLRTLPCFMLKFLSYLGSFSLELYLIHEFVFCIMNIELTINPLILLVSAFSISCFAAYMLNYVKSKITILICQYTKSWI